MKKNRQEEDEEIRCAKANIRTGFIIAVIVIALLAVIAFANGRAYERRHILSEYGHLGDT